MSTIRFVYTPVRWAKPASIIIGAASVPFIYLASPLSWATVGVLACLALSEAILIWQMASAVKWYRSRLESDFGQHLVNLIRLENPDLVRFGKQLPSEMLKEAVREMGE